MSSKGLFAGVFLICLWAFSEAQSSCKGRCGMGYYRGYTCQCDFSCVLYGECCKDYERLCTSKNSCKGRCGEAFKRGRICNCDADCAKYNQCCPDFTAHCEEMEEVEGEAPEKPESCDKNVQKNPTELAPDATEQPGGSEGDDPDIIMADPKASYVSQEAAGDNLIPTVNPTSYQNDDPDSASKQTGDVPDTSPLPESSSGSGSTTSEMPLEDSTSEPPLPDLDGFEIFPEPPEITVFQDETTETPMTTASQDETTETPMTTASQDETTETPMTTASQDETTETPMTTASQDETTEIPMTTASQDETTEIPMTTASQDETTEIPMTTASQDETTETPMTTASQDETTETPTTSASPDETEPPTTTASQEETTEISTTIASQEETTPSSTTTVPSTTEVTATEVTATEVTATEVTANRDADDTTVAPEPTDPQTNKPTNEPTVPPSETPETTTSLPESTESTAATELTTIFPTTANKETTSVPEMTTAELSTLAPVSEVSTAAEDTATAKEPDVTQSSTNAPSSKPAEKPIPERPFKPDLENKPVLNGLDDLTEYPADDSNDMNLCSGRPISGVTTLSNGTVVVFRGHFFWVLDRNRVPGPAQGITQVWGIPSPIDTVFTRCNCQAKTYIFKGPQYWRYENDALDPGYPKVIHTGFDGLRGHITAALSVPQYNRRRESVYFFKRGGNVQKYSYQFNPTCGRKVHYAVYTHRNRVARQAPAHASLLEPTINYRSSWTGFPTTITAAVSIPNKREPEGYSYYVFSRAKSYKIRIEGDRPVLAAAKPSPMPQSNEVFKCPRKLSK